MNMKFCYAFKPLYKLFPFLLFFSCYFFPLPRNQKHLFILYNANDVAFYSSSKISKPPPVLTENTGNKILRTQIGQGVRDLGVTVFVVYSYEYLSTTLLIYALVHLDRNVSFDERP